MALHELIYVSLADHAMASGELCALLTQARTFNREHGITGLLVYRNREFMQLLEGERDVVLALYRHIENDPRHRQVYRIWEGPIAARSCQDWAMGYAEPADHAWHALPDGRHVLDEGLFAAGQSSAGKRLMLRLRDDFLASAAA